MGLFGRRRSSHAIAPSNALVASAERVLYENAADWPRLLQPWQQDAFKFYYNIGEIHYASQFYAKGLSPLRTFVGRVDDQGEVTEVEANSQEAALWDRVQDPKGGRAKLFGNYGRLDFLTGEGFLTVTETKEGMESWEFLSGNELRVTSDNRYVRTRAPGLAPIEYWSAGDENPPKPGLGKATVYRMWTPDPQFSYLADSPMRAVLEICEELLLLTWSVAARTKNRLANAGVLLLNQDLDFGSPDGLNTENSNQSSFQQTLQRAMTTAVKEPGSASQVVPIVVPVPGSMIGESAESQAMRHIQFFNPEETYPEEGLRTELIKRIALGLDLPPEMLLGMTDSNHWSAWQVDSQVWKAHLEPEAQQMCDNFTGVYLRPAAEAEGISEPESLVIAYDEAKVVNHPNRFADFKDLHEAGVISAEALREAGGANDADKPTPLEHQEFLAIKLRDPLFVADEEAAGSGGTEPPGQANEVTPGPPDEKLIDSTDPINTNVASIMGAAEVAFRRCREMAGSRVRSKMRSGEFAEQINGHRNVLLASALGADAITSNGLVATDLVAGGASLFPEVAVDYGLDVRKAEQVAGLIETHAARTLFLANPGSLPKGMGDRIAKLLK